MELNKTAVSLCNTVIKGTTQTMAEGDVVVPDVKPDVLKILQVDAAACVTDKYIENGRLYISGRVDYKVLYIPDSEGERINSILTSMDFRQTVDAGRAEPGDTVFAAAEAERVEFGTPNSRKLRLRTIVHIDYDICRVTETELSTGAAEGAECECERVDIEVAADVSTHEFTVRERIEVPAGQSSIAEILKTDVRICDTGYKTVTGKIIIKANADICVLYVDDDGNIKHIEAELPFTEVLDADGVGDETVCDIDYSILNIMCEAEEDQDGDVRVAAADIDISAAVRGTETVTEEIMRDCFVPYSLTRIRREPVTVTRTVCRPSVQNNMREVIDVPDNVPRVAGVYNIIAEAAVTGTELKNGRLLCEGRVDAYVLYLTESAESPVYSIKKEIPFSYAAECAGAEGDEETEIKAGVEHIGYSLNSSGNIELRCLVGIDGRLIRREVIDNIVDIETDDMPERSGIFIYFAKDGDTLWDVAKHYSVPCSKIAKYNSIDGDIISAGARLFIPA